MSILMEGRKKGAGKTTMAANSAEHAQILDFDGEEPDTRLFPTRGIR